MKLSLPKHLERSLKVTLDWLKPFAGSEVFLSGGTVLAARWAHRLSTDIDLFYDVSQGNSAFTSESLAAWIAFLRGEAAAANIEGLRVYADGTAWRTSDGEVSLFKTWRFPDLLGEFEDTEASSGLSCETTADILFKKIRGRMAFSRRYLARDLYDIVCAKILEPESLDKAISILDFDEIDGIRYDAATGNIKINDFENLLNPVVLNITSSREDLQMIASQVLSGEITSRVDQLLRHAKEQFFDTKS